MRTFRRKQRELQRRRELEQHHAGKHAGNVQVRGHVADPAQRRFLISKQILPLLKPVFAGRCDALGPSAQFDDVRQYRRFDSSPYALKDRYILNLDL